jgi:hypothetical protein
MTLASSRIQEARRRALGAKRAAVALAAAGFVAVLVLARSGHPGQSSASSGSSGSGTQAGEEGNDDGLDFGSGSVSPSTATPQVQTSVS